jgi:hypothetical protein
MARVERDEATEEGVRACVRESSPPSSLVLSPFLRHLLSFLPSTLPPSLPPFLPFNSPPRSPLPLWYRRKYTHFCAFSPSLHLATRSGNPLGFTGWSNVADALVRVTSITSLNGCCKCAAIRTGGLYHLDIASTEIGVWAARFLERSASTLNTLDFRCHGMG